MKGDRLIRISNILVASIIIWVLIRINDTLNIYKIMEVSGTNGIVISNKIKKEK